MGRAAGRKLARQKYPRQWRVTAVIDELSLVVNGSKLVVRLLLCFIRLQASLLTRRPGRKECQLVNIGGPGEMLDKLQAFLDNLLKYSLPLPCTPYGLGYVRKVMSGGKVSLSNSFRAGDYPQATQTCRW